MIKVEGRAVDIGAICDSGQIFRMYRAEDGATYDLYAADRHLRLRQLTPGAEISMECTEEEYRDIWRGYFDLDRDYEEIMRAIDPEDGFLCSAAEACGGIRVLRQDIWEMMISFIISQQKQIPSIRKCIEALCTRYGEQHNDSTGVSWYGFPSAEAIAAGGIQGLAGLSLGYRERYIYETAVQYLDHGMRDEQVRSMGYSVAKQYLLGFTGIGEKVANCILLFGAGYTDAFPIDTHIRDIIAREYSGRSISGRDISLRECEELIGMHFDRYSGYRGIIQQWIFAYEIKKAGDMQHKSR